MSLSKSRLVGNLHFFPLMVPLDLSVKTPIFTSLFHQRQTPCHAMQPVMRQPQCLQYIQGCSFALYLNSDPKSRTQSPVNAACVYVRHCMLCDGYHVHLICRVLFSSLQISLITIIPPPSGRLLVWLCQISEVVIRS
jgi:hypothetical protein